MIGKRQHLNNPNENVPLYNLYKLNPVQVEVEDCMSKLMCLHAYVAIIFNTLEHNCQTSINNFGTFKAL